MQTLTHQSTRLEATCSAQPSGFSRYGGWRLGIKVVLDRLLASFALVVLAPLLVVVAVAVRLTSRGPALFRQYRVGRHGKLFAIYKFRSMRDDAEAWLAQNPELARRHRNNDFKLQIEEDVRVTSLGRWLRRTSLDELPQLINIVRGEMSFVGPRPVVPDEVSCYGSYTASYVAAYPGLTGLWQVSGHQAVTYPLRARLDADYVEGWSIWSDFSILVRTLPAMFRKWQVQPTPIVDLRAEPSVSLVVSTIGRPDELDRFLTSVAREAAHVRLEVIIVDQSGAPHTAQMVDRHREQLTIRHLPCTERGVSLGRNLGLRAARGRYVMFPDDDAWFPGQMLTRAVDRLEADLKLDGVCARLASADGSSSMLRWKRRSCRVSRFNHHRTSIGSAIMVRTNAARRVGGFNEAMGPGARTWHGSCEDADFLLKVVAEGNGVHYDPLAVVYHRDARADEGAAATAKSLAYGCGQGELWRQHLPLWWSLTLLARRIASASVADLRGHRGVGRVRRAWVRGAVNGLLEQPPADIGIDGYPRRPNTAEWNASMSRTFGLPLRWRLGLSAVGISSSVTLVAIAALEFTDAELAALFVLLALLAIGPVLGRVGCGPRIVHELRGRRAAEDVDSATRAARLALRAVWIPTTIGALGLSLALVGTVPAARALPVLGLSVAVVIAESIRKSYADVFLGLGLSGWSAMLASQIRALIVCGVVVALVVAGVELTLMSVLVVMAVVGGSLAVIAAVRFSMLRPGSITSIAPVRMRTLISVGLPLMIVELAAIGVVRGDVWLASLLLDEADAAAYGTASIVAMQVAVPIGLASAALTPAAIDHLRQGRIDDLQLLVGRVVNVLTVLAVMVTIAVVFVGRPFLGQVFGSRFTVAWDELVILSVGNVAFVVFGVGTVVLVVANRQRLAMQISVVWLLLAAFAMVIGGGSTGSRGLAIGSSFATIGLGSGIAVAAWVTTGVRVMPDPRRTSGSHPRHLHPAIPTTFAPGPRSVWWQWPAAPLVFLVAPTLVAAAVLPESTYLEAWRTPKAIDLTSLTVLAGGLASMLLGALALWLIRESPPQASPARFAASIPTRRLELVFVTLLGLSLFGYVVWIANGVLNEGLRFGDAMDLLRSQDNSALLVKSKLPTIPGVTSLTQLAIAAVIVGVVLDLRRPTRWVRYGYRAVIVLAMVRAYFLAERLAVIELLLPLCTLRAAAWFMRGNRAQRRAVAFVPVVAAIMLMTAFVGAEASRSWTYYREEREQSLMAFGTERLLGYYVTAMNNGAILLDQYSRAGDQPFETVAFFWEAPLTSFSPETPVPFDGPALVADAAERRSDALDRFGNPEFNSPGGLAAPFVDFGVVGGIAFFAFAGLVIGGLHDAFLRGTSSGVFLYPLAFVGLLELPRFQYWAQGRVTPAIVSLFFVTVVVSRIDRLREVSALVLDLPYFADWDRAE